MMPGLLAALPAVLILAALLAQADPLFARVIGMHDVGTQSALTVGAWAGAAAWLAAGLHVRRRQAGVSVREAIPLLAMTGVLFLTFAALQLRYLAGVPGATADMLRLGYGQYARTGFFELVTVAGLTLAILVAADAGVIRRSERDRRIFTRLIFAILGLLGVIVVSALGRVLLHGAMYGANDLRFLATGFVVWLIVVSGWFAGSVLRAAR